MGDTNNLFSQQQQQAPEITGEAALADLVGEGKKYATVEDLAKGMVHGQHHIGTLEHETATLREQSSSNKSIEDVLAAIKGTQEPAAQQPAATDQSQQPASSDVSIADQIAAAFKDRDNQVVATTESQNRATLVKDLGALYGADAVTLYAQVGSDLGINLDELAGKSPAAVMKLIADARPAPQVNHSQALPNGQQLPLQQPQGGGQGVLNQSAIKQLYADKKISMTQKHEMENRQLTLLGSNAFYK